MPSPHHQPRRADTDDGRRTPYPYYVLLLLDRDTHRAAIVGTPSVGQCFLTTREARRVAALLAEHRPAWGWSVAEVHPAPVWGHIDPADWLNGLQYVDTDRGPTLSELREDRPGDMRH